MSTERPDEEPPARRERLADIAAENAEELHDRRAARQLAGLEPVWRYAAVTSEGSPESSLAEYGRLIVADTPGALAERLRQECDSGRLAHGRTWDLEADWSPDGNLGSGYAVYLRPPDGEAAWSEGEAPRPPVWVCTFQHRHGLDAWVAVDEDAAYESFAVTVRSFWREAVELDRGPRDDDRPPLPEKAPADDRSAVESYFAVMGEAPQPEFFSIERQEVIEGGED